MITRTDIWAVIIGAAMLTGYIQYQKSAQESAPATDWFVVRGISVADFVQGENPPVVYDRVIKKPFDATWSAEIHNAAAGPDYAICSGSGTNFYEPKETLPETGVNMSWFIGAEAWKLCSLNEGQYVIKTRYEMRPSGYPIKYYEATSNIFRVLPRGAQLYVTPKQVDQLEKAQELLNDPIPLIEGTTP